MSYEYVYDRTVERHQANYTLFETESCEKSDLEILYAHTANQELFSMTKTTAVSAPSSYERLGARVQKIINSPTAQKSRTALLMRQADDVEDEWNQILGEIAENDNVTLAYRDDGGVQIFWTVPKED